MSENTGTYEVVPEPAGGKARCAKCDEIMPTDTILLHVAVCQGIDITRADEWPIVDETGEADA